MAQSWIDFNPHFICLVSILLTQAKTTSLLVDHVSKAAMNATVKQARKTIFRLCKRWFFVASWLAFEKHVLYFRLCKRTKVVLKRVVLMLY